MKGKALSLNLLKLDLEMFSRFRNVFNETENSFLKKILLMMHNYLINTRYLN